MTYLSPRWTGEIYDCSMPMTFDQYSNCGFGCVYCFAQYQRGVGVAKEEYLARKVKKVSIDRIKKMFLLKKETQFSDYIRQRKVMQWGGMSDPFCWIEKQENHGLELLKFFKEINYPLCFSTKGVWWLEDKRYTDLFRGQKNWNVKVSIITLNEKKAKLIEAGVVTPKERLEGIRKIAELNCGGATLRLRPFIIGVSNPHHIELIEMAGKLGATALSTEFFCLDTRSPTLKEKFPIFEKCCGFNILKFYKKYSKGSGYLRLNRNIKRKFVNEMEEACKDAGMRFYVSDADYKERCCNGSCCGLPETWNYSRGQTTHALMIAKNNGTVKFSDIKKDMQMFKKFIWKRSEGFNVNNSKKRARFDSMTMYDFLKWCWNNPNNGHSPYKEFRGTLIPCGKCEEGNVIYKYNR